MSAKVRDLPFQRGQDIAVPAWATPRQAAMLIGEEPTPENCDECGQALRDSNVLSRDEFFEERQSEWRAELLGDGSTLLSHGDLSLRFCNDCTRLLGRWLWRFARAREVPNDA